MLNLKYSETTALFMLLMIGQLLSYILWGWYSVTDPVYQAFVQAEMVWYLLRFCVLSVLIGGVWLAACLYHRHAREQVQRVLMVGGMAIFLLVMLFAGWASGLFAMSLGAVLAATPFVGMIVFPARAVLITTGLGCIAIVIMAIATVQGVLPYAPLFQAQLMNESHDYAAFYFASQIYFVFPFLVLTILTSLVYLMQASQREAQILHLSQTDSLTQLYNRRTAQEALTQRLSRSERRPLSVVLLDLDFFKKINDQHGHLVGDRVLMAVAAVLRDSVRQNDLVARFGGEEFLLVLDGMSCNSAKNVAERCRQQIAACVVLNDHGHAVALSASFGVACMITNGDPIPVDEILRQADHALYAAKDAGRNQVVGHACPNAAMSMTHPLLRRLV
ncbi:MAG: GGDEF domain-containing protein [Moraxellaceae bacterium]